MAASPVQPVAGVAGRARTGEDSGEQVPDLRDGQRDHSRVGGWLLIGPGRRWCLGAGAVAEQGGGDGADRQGGHHPGGARERPHRSCASDPDGTLAAMSCWQYAQLTITVDGRDPHGARTILWHGPGQGVGENYSDSGHTVLELLNRFGATAASASTLLLEHGGTVPM